MLLHFVILQNGLAVLLLVKTYFKLLQCRALSKMTGFKVATESFTRALTYWLSCEKLDWPVNSFNAEQRHSHQKDVIFRALNTLISHHFFFFLNQQQADNSDKFTTQKNKDFPTDLKLKRADWILAHLSRASLKLFLWTSNWKTVLSQSVEALSLPPCFLRKASNPFSDGYLSLPMNTTETQNKTSRGETGKETSCGVTKTKTERNLGIALHF